MSRSRRWRGVAFTIAALAVLGFAAFAALWIPSAKERMLTERAACASCHRAAATHQSAHRALACQTCHEVSDHAALTLAWQELTGAGDAEDAIAHGAAKEGACRTCHEAGAHWRAQMQTAGHRRHVLDASLPCTTCHADAMHAVSPAPRCEGCHDDTPVLGAIGPGDCITCHRFSAGDADALALPASAAPFTTGVGVDRVHGAGDCRGCHDPHRQGEEPIACQRCHRGVLAEDVAAGPEGHAQCSSCHAAHAPREAPATSCVRCHSPPPAGATNRRRSEESHWTMVTPRPGPPPDASDLTHDGACGTCHTPHTFEASPEGCRGCHDAQRTTIEGVAGHPTCIGCHEPHSPPPDATACEGCHRDKPAGAAVFAAAVPAGAVPGAAARAPAHRCLDCHGAHEGTPEVLATCTACHPGPGAALDRVPSAHATCGACHDVHGAPGRDGRAPCAHCHAPQARRSAGANAPRAHDACTTCHVAHEVAPPEVARPCAACHERIAANAWPDAGPHAGACATCHDAHAARATPPCGRCHQPQNVRSHVGGHAGCVTCHAVHGERPERGWWTTCATCHERQAARPGPGPHARCAGCHEPVGARPPTCLSCHETIPTQLQHALAGHRRCSDCHPTHAVDDIGRGTCTQCHEAQETDHFPDAATCDGCHPFAD